MAQAPGNPIARLEYRNPVTGGPALATLGCLLEGLAAGARTRPCRETASSVLVVARGTGTLRCGDRTFALLPKDVAAIPAWTWHQLIAADQDLVLFRVTDRPIHDAFGLFRAEETEALPPAPADGEA
jgi:gentisate 1,2-dioxygenase